MAAWLLAYEARLSYVYMLLLTGLEIYIYIYTPIPGPAPLNKKIVGFTWRGVLDPFMPRRDHAAASRNPQWK
jgi:hypothetical protein